MTPDVSFQSFLFPSQHPSFAAKRLADVIHDGGFAEGCFLSLVWSRPLSAKCMPWLSPHHVLCMHDSCPAVFDRTPRAPYDRLACSQLRLLFPGANTIPRFGASTVNELSITSTRGIASMLSMVSPAGTSDTESACESSALAHTMLSLCGICSSGLQEKNLSISTPTT